MTPENNTSCISLETILLPALYRNKPYSLLFNQNNTMAVVRKAQEEYKHASGSLQTCSLTSAEKYRRPGFCGMNAYDYFSQQIISARRAFISKNMPVKK
jgi:hypothetical protein